LLSNTLSATGLVTHDVSVPISEAGTEDEPTSTSGSRRRVVPLEESVCARPTNQARSSSYHDKKESESAAGNVKPTDRSKLHVSLSHTKESVLSGYYHQYVYPWGVSETAPVYSWLHSYFEASCDLFPNKVALLCVETKQKHTYNELDQLANRLAHFLRDHYHVQPGSRVGIFLARSLDMYVSLLAVLKCGAAYVPMDPAFPSERLKFMAQDSEASLLLTTSKFLTNVSGVNCTALALDLVKTSVLNKPNSRLVLDDSMDSSCYIIYTSGTSGKPKGVCISHANICNFISVVVPLYGVSHNDRVYQGITIAFDFSIEEIWPTFAVGATLVAGPTDHRKLGSELAKVLHETETTVLHCVPTLLSTIDQDLPLLKIINVGGEACLDELVRRWSTGRTLLNTYGPTETTVTASLAFLKAGKQVTIGKPLPTYTMYILDENQQPVHEGELGEIWIGGKGVAKEYLNRPDKTAAAFYPNFLDPTEDGKESGRLFRTGDVGRLTSEGEIEIKGRIDDQVKIRGYRIELSEIEAVIQGECIFLVSRYTFAVFFTL